MEKQTNRNEEESKSKIIKVVIAILLALAAIFGIKTLSNNSKQEDKPAIVEEEQKDDEQKDEDEKQDEEDQEDAEEEDQEQNEDAEGSDEAKTEDQKFEEAINLALEDFGLEIEYGEIQEKDGVKYVMGQGKDLSGKEGYIAIRYNDDGTATISSAEDTEEATLEAILK